MTLTFAKRCISAAHANVPRKRENPHRPLLESERCGKTLTEAQKNGLETIVSSPFTVRVAKALSARTLRHRTGSSVSRAMGASAHPAR